MLVVLALSCARRRQPAAQPHRPALAGGAGQRAGCGGGWHRRRPGQARRLRGVVRARRAGRRAARLRHHHAVDHLVPGHRRARGRSPSPTWPGSRASPARCWPGSSPRPGSCTTVLDGGQRAATRARYVFAISGLLLIVTAIAAPEGITGLVRAQLERRAERRHRAPVRQPSSDRRSTWMARLTDRRSSRSRELTVRYGGVVALDPVSTSTWPPARSSGSSDPTARARRPASTPSPGSTLSPRTGRSGSTGDRLDGLSPHTSGPAAGFARTFQSLELFDDLSVRENLLVARAQPDLAVDAHRRAPAQGPMTARRVDEVLDLLGLRRWCRPPPDALSNGQRHLVGPGRAAWWRDPRLVLLDEPAAGLDTSETAELGELLLRPPCHDGGTSVLLVDHDMALVLGVCDRVHVLDFGRLIASRPPGRGARRPRGRQRIPRSTSAGVAPVTSP